MSHCDWTSVWITAAILVEDTTIRDTQLTLSIAKFYLRNKVLQKLNAKCYIQGNLRQPYFLLYLQCCSVYLSWLHSAYSGKIPSAELILVLGSLSGGRDSKVILGHKTGFTMVILPRVSIKNFSATPSTQLSVTTCPYNDRHTGLHNWLLWSLGNLFCQV